MAGYLNAEMSAEEFLTKLKIIMPEDCKAQKTVVFFDEIQKCPEIVTKIKFLVDEGSFRYVMSGSLLGVELKGIASAPVGYLTILKMYPMDFEEFMIANDVSSTTLEMLQEKFETCCPVDKFMNVSDYHLEKAYVFSVGNVEVDGRVIYLPIYMCYLLKEKKIDPMIIDLDLTGL